MSYGYTSRATGALTDEERDVRAALSGCGCTTAGATSRDWTPVARVYRVYVAWYARHRWQRDPYSAERLTTRQFGHAMRRVFPGIKRCKRASSRLRREWGYAFLAGDFSIETRPPRHTLRQKGRRPYNGILQYPASAASSG